MIKLIINIIIIGIVIAVVCNLVTTDEEYKDNFSQEIERPKENITNDIEHILLVGYASLYNITDNIKPLYMKNVRRIKFINYNGRYYGKTINGRDISINLTGDLSVDKVTFCHELIHTIFWSSDIDLDEEVAEDLSKQLVCYK